MNNEQHHPEHAQEAFLDALFEESPINIAALLRACADGELNERQCERLKQVIADQPEAPVQHDFEQALRGCCGRVMHKPACPKALRERVGAIAAASSVGSPQPVQNEQYAQGTDAAGAYTTDRSFWARSPVMGIAAALMLSFAGVLIWQSTNFASNAVTPRAGMTMEQASYTENVGRFVLKEHDRCCIDAAAQAKLIKHDINSAINYFSEVFGSPVHMPDMTQTQGRIEFFGGGECAVPSTSRSGHLRFDALDDVGNTIPLSLFISPNPGILPLEEGVTYRLGSKACEEAGASLYVWVSDGIQYLLVSEATDSDCAKVRGLMNAPEALSQI
jgi:hypothetical protein